jgi:hypothetical protein
MAGGRFLLPQRGRRSADASGCATRPAAPDGQPMLSTLMQACQRRSGPL